MTFQENISQGLPLYTIFEQFLKKFTLKTLLNLILILFTISTFSQKYIYLEKSGDKRYYYYFELKKDGDRVIQVTEMKDKDKILEKQVLITDHDYKSIKWTYERGADQTKGEARVKDDELHIYGVQDGDDFSDDEDLDDEPWLQLYPFNHSLDNFIQSDEEEIIFWAIGTRGAGDMKATRFEATKEGYEDILVNGKKERGYKVHLTLAGWRSLFWSGDMWFRPGDWRMLKYDGGGPPGEPDSVTELIDEE